MSPPLCVLKRQLSLKLLKAESGCIIFAWEKKIKVERAKVEPPLPGFIARCLKPSSGLGSGHDYNDLPLGMICETIAKNIREIMDRSQHADRNLAFEGRPCRSAGRRRHQAGDGGGATTSIGSGPGNAA